MSRIRLTWNNASTTIVEQRVYRSTSPLDFDDMPDPLAVLPRRDREYLDSAIEDGLTYYYAVSSALPDYSELISEQIKVEASPVESDPHWDKVVSLLSFNDLSDPWKDHSGSVWSGQAGSAAIMVGGGPFGMPYMRFRGDTFLQMSDATVSTGEPITIESYFRKTADNRGLGTQLILGLYESNTRRMSYYWTDAGDTGDVFRVYQRPSIPNNSSTRVILERGFLEGTWEHVAYVRDSGGHRLYIGGVLVASSGQPLNGMTGAFHLGSLQPGVEALYGDVSNLRVTFGVARYTENFTPPTKPFPNK